VKRLRLCAVKKFALVVFVAATAHSSVQAREGLLNASYEEVAAILGKPSSHESGKVSGIAYERYHFETVGWKTTVLFVNGKAQKLDTEKSDGSPLTAEDKTVIFDRYDLPNTDQNLKIRGWRELAEKHFIRGDGRVRITLRPASITIFLDDLPREFW
jgi:hypothetical protein